MKKIFITAFSFMGIFCFSIPNSYAETVNINNLVFTTDPQTIKPSVISDEIIVQTQNGSGGAEKVDETNDVTFSSTSATGEFLNSSGNPVTTTMSTNTSSRTFYYRDSTLGSFNITITIKGRTSGKIFSATQQIIISDSSGSIDTQTGNTSASTTGNTNTSNTSSSINTSSEGFSAHSSGTKISEIRSSLKFEGDAGRERIVSVNTPVKFDAKISDVPSGWGSATYGWTFGDGTYSSGKNVKHTYLFPGEYNVVLNVKIDNDDAVARSKIKVIEPIISIIEVDKTNKPFVTLKNNSAIEINIGGFELTSASSSLFFPEDTIISSGATLRFPVVFQSYGDKIALLYPNRQPVSFFQDNFVLNDVQKTEAISKIENALVILKSELSSINNVSSISLKSDYPVPEADLNSQEEVSNNDQTAALIEAFNEDTTDTFLSKSFKFIKELFIWK